jgi:hypothetical protein
VCRAHPRSHRFQARGSATIRGRIVSSHLPRGTLGEGASPSHRIGYQLSAIVYQLLRNNFDLLVDDLAGKPIDRHMHPIPLLAFDDEPSEVGSTRRIFPALRDNIN